MHKAAPCIATPVRASAAKAQGAGRSRRATLRMLHTQELSRSRQNAPISLWITPWKYAETSRKPTKSWAFDWTLRIRWWRGFCRFASRPDLHWRERAGTGAVSMHHLGAAVLNVGRRSQGSPETVGPRWRLDLRVADLTKALAAASALGSLEGGCPTQSRPSRRSSPAFARSANLVDLGLH